MECHWCVLFLLLTSLLPDDFFRMGVHVCEKAVPPENGGLGPKCLKHSGLGIIVICPEK